MNIEITKAKEYKKTYRIFRKFNTIFFSQKLETSKLELFTQKDKVLSIYELTSQIKIILETDFEKVAVIGEISNFKRHSSGHLYFTLKDANSQLSCVMWRGRNSLLPFTPRDGMKVIARGSITVYEVRGNYQLDCIELQPAGIGELQLAYEQLKQKLSSEGLFDAEQKKTLPQFPERIGIVTSPTGAALQDMLNIISRRFPSVEIILYPVRVQGVGAKEEIAQAIRDFNAYKNIDVMIIGRGGGNLEDLWAFNEEIVARAIFDSTIPIVSAVGHEIDFSISDFVADLRAPTPSAAAELVVPNKQELLGTLRDVTFTMFRNVNEQIESPKERIQSMLHSYSFRRPFDSLRQYIQRIDEFQSTIQRISEFRFQSLKKNIDSFALRLQSLNPNAVLKRGYAIVYANNKAISSSKKLHAKEKIDLKFYDGKVSAEIIS